jgi:hypothetical protein
MKKILLAFSQDELSDAPLSFVAQLNRKMPLLVTAIFLPHVVLGSFWTTPGVLSDPVLVPLTEDTDPAIYQQTKQRFRDRCISEGVPFRIHENYKESDLPEIIRESRFADLMIICGTDYFDTPYFDLAWDNLHHTLHDIECPVLVLPPNDRFPKENIVAYDGSASSVYALKQFAYLFPELAVNETTLVYAHEKHVEEIPDVANVEELAAQHFGKLTITQLDMNPKKDFPAWLQVHNDPILICGSMGRSMLSQAFHKSFAYRVIQDRKLPVFIAHR